MRIKKIVKLINNERTDRNVLSHKASDNVCAKVDYASCPIYSYDICGKDYAGCSGYSYDYCENVDTDACVNSSYDYN